MIQKIVVPDLLIFLEDVKSLFSIRLDNSQQDHYQCLLLWIQKITLLELQSRAGSVSTELVDEVIDLLGPTQEALTSSSVTLLDRNNLLFQLYKRFDDFYLSLSTLPASKPNEDILNTWQQLYGHGSSPPVITLPQPALTNESTPCNPFYEIFTNDKDIPWTREEKPCS